ncbi:hypothetical protein ACWGOQ_0020060 [Aquimarina sp. M1]
MLKDILKLEGAQEIDKSTQNQVSGGGKTATYNYCGSVPTQGQANQKCANHKPWGYKVTSAYVSTGLHSNCSNGSRGASSIHCNYVYGFFQ